MSHSESSIHPSSKVGAADQSQRVVKLYCCGFKTVVQLQLGAA